MSRKGKTRCTPTTRAPAERERGSVRRPGPRCGRGGRLATPPPSAAQFWVGLGVGRGWWREGGGGGGGGAGMRTARDHEQPIPQTATEQKSNSFKDFIWSNNGISNSI